MNLTKRLNEIEGHLYSLNEQDWGDRIGMLRKGLNDRDLRVVVFGEFNRGKSTLINALLGREVLPAGLIPTTGQLVVLQNCNRPHDEKAQIHFLDGRVEAVPVDTLESCAGLNEQGQARRDIAKIEMTVCGCPLLDSGITLVDTPGLNDHEAQTERAKSAISEADLVLLVLDARALLTESERELAVDWLGQSLGKPVVPIVNFMNLLPEKERKKVRRRLELWSRSALSEELGHSWFEVDALGALHHELSSEPATSDHFQALYDGLTGLKGKKRKTLQQRSRRGQLLAEMREVSAHNAQKLSLLREDSARVEKERSEQREVLRDLCRRFDANASSQMNRIWTFAEVRLKQGIDRFDATLRGYSKEELEKKASTQLNRRLSSAVSAIDKKADKALEELAGVDEVAGCGARLRRPEPMSLRERMILDARVEVELFMGEADITTVGAGGLFGGAVGQFVIPIPVVGPMIGGMIGSWLAGWFGKQEPDYGAAYAESVRKLWEDAENRIMATLVEQFEGRCAQLANQLESDLKALDEIGSNSLESESRHCETLEVLLSKCEKALASSHRI